MAERIFLHIGTPKTGTTFLQTILWGNRQALAEQGLLVPGKRRAEHLWASRAVRGETKWASQPAQAPGAWDRIVQAARQWPGSVIVSHEFFGAASESQARTAVDALAPAEVHLIVTARECVGMLTSRWQEWVKNGSRGPLSSYGGSTSDDPLYVWDWRTMDVAEVLSRWGTQVPPERVHVIPLPTKDAPPDELLRRFAKVVGFSVDGLDTSAGYPNQSLGVASVELLRRVNAHLMPAFAAGYDRGRWIRGYLAQGKMVPLGGNRFGPDGAQLAALRDRSDRTIDFIKRHGFDVVGDLSELATPASLPKRRHPDEVTDSELLDVATKTIAAMLDDVRRLTDERDSLRRTLKSEQQRPASPGGRSLWRRLIPMRLGSRRDSPEVSSGRARR